MARDPSNSMRALGLVSILTVILFTLGCAPSPAPRSADGSWRTPPSKDERRSSSRLPEDLAERVVAVLAASTDGIDELGPSDLDRARAWLRAFYPGTEIYVLDARGTVLYHAAELGVPTRPTVPMTAVRQCLDRRDETRALESGASAGAPPSENLGWNPHSPEEATPFVAAEISARSESILYLIRPQQSGITLDGTAPRSARRSTAPILGTAAILSLSGTILLLVADRLRLARSMRSLGISMDALEPESTPWPDDAPTGRGSLQRLRGRFSAMSGRVRARLDDAERLDEMRRELFTNLSHDLRTPIATLRGYLETLCLGSATLTPEQRTEYQAIALKHAERLGRLVDELLELAKLDGGKVSPAMERIPFGELVQDNAQRFLLRAKSKSIKLQADIEPGLEPVQADVGLMERALENLIENALRHTPPGGRVTVSLGRGDGRVIVRVEDTGCGISEDDLPHVFDRFYSAKSGRGSGGTGLGLAITRRIVELHQSTLEVESRVGLGTAFYFSLAVAPPTRARTLTTRLTRHLSRRRPTNEEARSMPTGDTNRA